MAERGKGPHEEIDWVARAAELRELLDTEADSGDRQGITTPAVVDALFESGLMTVAVPAECGGGEADLLTQVKVYEELSAASPSAGWSHMAGATASAFCAAFMADDEVRTMFDGGRTAHAGQFAPRGTFTEVDGGYRVEGEYSFASGSGHATHITAGGLVIRYGEMVLKDDGMPEMRVAAFPRAEVELQGNWHVLGLQGTESQDYAVRDQFVPCGRTFELFDETPLRGGPQFTIGIMPMTSAGHAGWALGVGHRALSEIASLAQVKQRMGAESVLARQQLFQKEYAEQRAALTAARSYVHTAFGDIQAAAETGTATRSHKAEVRTATTWATRVAADVVQWSYRLGGGDALRDGHPLQRCMRDIHAGTQHIFVDDSTYIAASQVWLDVAEGFVFL